MKGLQRVGSAAAAIQREHEVGDETLAYRVLRHELLRLGDELGVPAGRQIGLDARFEHRDALLLQAVDLGARERLERELGQCRPAPQRKRLAQEPRRMLRLTAGQRSPPVLDQALELRESSPAAT